jgi:hypothetical protein
MALDAHTCTCGCLGSIIAACCSVPIGPLEADSCLQRSYLCQNHVETIR